MHMITKKEHEEKYYCPSNSRQNFRRRSNLNNLNRLHCQLRHFLVLKKVVPLSAHSGSVEESGEWLNLFCWAFPHFQRAQAWAPHLAHSRQRERERDKPDGREEQRSSFNASPCMHVPRSLARPLALVALLGCAEEEGVSVCLVKLLDAVWCEALSIRTFSVFISLAWSLERE